MRIISFCADGIIDAADRGFFEWVESQEADIVCIQNLKAQEHEIQADRFHPQGLYGYFFDNYEGHNGVGIYVRQIPRAIMTGLGMNERDIEARYIQADFDQISVGCLLAPNAYGGDQQVQADKLAFLEHYQNHLNKIRHKRREYVICASWFSAHQVRDLQHAKRLEGKPGFNAEESDWFDHLFRDLGYCDAFRRVNSDSDEFTWWPENDRDTDGMRADMQIVSDGLRQRIEYGVGYKNQIFGSHAPVVMDYDIEL